MHRSRQVTSILASVFALVVQLVESGALRKSSLLFLVAWLQIVIHTIGLYISRRMIHLIS